MANIHSQKKRILRTERERLENRRYTSTIKTYFRRLEAAVTAGDADTAATEHLTLVRSFLSGERVDHDGEFFSARGARLGVRLGERRPKLVLAALNPGMLRLAGELADGVLLNYLPASHVAESVAHVREGEAAAGRPAGSTTVYAYVHAGVCASGPTGSTPPAVTCSPTPWSTPTRGASSGPASARRSPPCAPPTPPATGRARWRR